MNLVPIPQAVERLIQLRHQHMIKWQNHLADEIKAQIELETQHQTEISRLFKEECHYSQRAVLIRQQLQALAQLKMENRAKRLLIRAGQQREQYDLEQPINSQNEAS